MRWPLLLLACATGCASVPAGSPSAKPPPAATTWPTADYRAAQLPVGCQAGCVDDDPAVVRLPPIDCTEEPGLIRLPPIEGFDDAPPLDVPLDVEHPNLLARIGGDYRHYYSCKNLTWLAAGLGVGAIMANTNIDQAIQHKFQQNVRNAKSDEFSEWIDTPMTLGNGAIMIPVFAGSMLVGTCFDERPAGHCMNEWGERSLRTLIVGAPPMLAFQWITGGSRPGEVTTGSQWKPFKDNNGVSGHAFIGAVPFLTAAKMAEGPLWKAGFYAASVLPGLARINTNAHYSSQAFLGWWMAYLAASAVDDTQEEIKGWTVVPLMLPDTVGVGVQYCH